MNRTRAILSVAVFALIAASILTGCSADRGGPVVEAGHVKLALSAGWEAMPPQGGKWTAAFKHKETGAQLQIAGEYSRSGNAQAVLGVLRGHVLFAVPSFEPVSTEDITIPKAQSAIQARYTYLNGTTAMEGAWIVASQWPYPADAVLALSGESITPALVDDVKAGFTWKLYE